MTGRQPPKRIILATFGSPGDVRPFLAIGLELRTRGYEPIVATSAHHRDEVDAANLGFAPVRPDRIPDQPDPDFVDRLLRQRLPPRDVFRAMFWQSLRESVEDLLLVTNGAEAIVSHTLMPAARLAAEVLNVPWISAVMQPMGYVSAYEPPVVVSPRVAAVMRAAGPRPTTRVLRAARWLTARWTADWHAVRAELRLRPVPEHPLWEGQHAPRRSLGLFPAILGSPQTDWPPQARVTGFPFYRTPMSRLDPDVAQFLADGEPPLIFTLGTTAVNDPGSFYEESVLAARVLGLRALLLAGPGSRDRLNRPDAGVLAVPHARHDLVFPHAAAIVHQGGIGTLAEGLLAGRPMLIMPYGHDQADNAWRASRLGVARVVARKRYRARVVSREIDRLLHNRETREAAERAAHSVAEERGAHRAAELIDAALRID